MMDIRIEQLLPAFLLSDREGFAIAKALEHGLKKADEIIQQGVRLMDDVDSMPEWRLDELAWEYNCPYDYSADVEIKRRWIRDVMRLSRTYGTPNAIYEYLACYFESIRIEEAAAYGGEPFHFRVLFSGLWTNEKVAWATNAINAIKPVRSVLDQYNFHNSWKTPVFAGCALYGNERNVYMIPGVIPDELKWYIDENSDMLTDEDGMLLYAEEDNV